MKHLAGWRVSPPQILRFAQNDIHGKLRRQDARESRETQLARQLGMRQPQVARLEIGEHTPSLDTLRRLAQLLGMRLIVAISPAADGTPPEVPLPKGMKVLEA